MLNVWNSFAQKPEVLGVEPRLKDYNSCSLLAASPPLIPPSLSSLNFPLAGEAPHPGAAGPGGCWPFTYSSIISIARFPSSPQAKRLIRELQAQVAAAKALRLLDPPLAKRPCGSAPLKAAISKAEAAAAALSAAGSGSCAFQEMLLPRLGSARKRLEAEKVRTARFATPLTLTLTLTPFDCSY